MISSGLTAVTGKLRVSVGGAQPLRCERAAASGALLRRIVCGRVAEQVPQLLGALYSLCGELHRLTAQRALACASGISPDADAVEREQRYLHAACLREHLLHVGLSWQARALSARAPSAANWLRGLPMLAAGSGAWAELVRFTEQRLLTMPACSWWRRFGANGVSEWAAACSGEHPVAAWWQEQAPRARGLQLRLRPLRVSADDKELPLMAAAMQRDTEFAQHAHHRSQPIDTGAFSREAGAARANTAEDLLAARMTELVRLCQPAPWLRSGALRLGSGAAMAYTEIARGLLVHYVQLAGPVVDDYRVVVPTDFCLHPQGALSERLAAPGLAAVDVQLLMAAFDPCVDVECDDQTAGASRPERPGHA